MFYILRTVCGGLRLLEVPCRCWSSTRTRWRARKPQIIVNNAGGTGTGRTWLAKFAISVSVTQIEDRPLCMPVLNYFRRNDTGADTGALEEAEIILYPVSVLTPE